MIHLCLMKHCMWVKFENIHGSVYLHTFNSAPTKLGQHWFRYWLVAYSAPSHYLNQCWFIATWTLRNKLQWNFNQSTKVFIHENAYENIVCAMAAILQSGGDGVGGGCGCGVGDELKTALRMWNINNVLYEYFHMFDQGCDLLDVVLFISTLLLLIKNELYIYICITLCPRFINGKHTRTQQVWEYRQLRD